MNNSIDSITSEVNSHLASESETSRCKYLVFSLMNENYGVPLSFVKEVIGLIGITQIPDAPDYVVGLINLRGKIISVIDLRAKLKMTKESYQEKKTAIVITEIGDQTIGTIVDDVKEVANFEMSQVESQLNIQNNTNKEYVVGVAKTKDTKLTLLLDLGKILDIDTINLIKNNNSSSAA